MIHKFDGQSVLVDFALKSFSSLLSQLNLRSIPDNFPPKTPLVEKFEQTNPDAMLSTIINSRNFAELLSLPQEMQTKLVVYRNPLIDRSLYDQLQDKGIVLLERPYTDPMNILFQAFHRVLLSNK